MSDHPEPTRGLTMVFSDAAYAHDSGEYALGVWWTDGESWGCDVLPSGTT